MTITLRRDPRTVIPDFIDWFEEPFLTLRPYLGQAIRVEDYTEDGHYVVRAEIAGISGAAAKARVTESGLNWTRAAPAAVPPSSFMKRRRSSICRLVVSNIVISPCVPIEAISVPDLVSRSELARDE